MHVTSSAQWGVDLAELESTPLHAEFNNTHGSTHPVYRTQSLLLPTYLRFFLSLDISTKAIKTRILSTAGVVRAVARTLLECDALGTHVDELLLFSAVITPNMDKGALLLHHLKCENRRLGAYHRWVMCCALSGGVELVKGRYLPRGSVNLAYVVLASVGTSTAGVVV